VVKFKAWRSKKHLAKIRQMPCCVCGATPSDPHHIVGVGNGIMGSKASDSMVTPLCRLHHGELHEGKRQDRQWEWLARTLAGMLEHG